jgi:hypothetical protein
VKPIIAAMQACGATPALVATIAGFGESGRMLVATNAVFVVPVDSFEKI